MAARLASAGRQHESLPRSIRSSPGIRTAGRTGVLQDGLRPLRRNGGHPADNYYNPFGIDLPVIWRRLVEAGNRRNEQEVDLWRALVGLEGSVDRWTWEVALQGARAEATAVEKGFLSRPRLASALGPSGLDDSGRIVCGSPDPATGRVPAASIIPDCVPLNLFGGAGSITEEQLAYVIPGTMINRGTNEQRLRGVRPERPGRADAGQGRAVGAGRRLPARSRKPGAGFASCRLRRRPVSDLAGPVSGSAGGEWRLRRI